MRLPALLLVAAGAVATLMPQAVHAEPAETTIAVAHKIAAITAPPGLFKKTYDALVPQMIEAMFRGQLGNVDFDARKNDDDFIERLRRSSEIVSAELGIIVSPFEEKLRDAYATAYSRQFDEAALKQVLSFYETPVGRQFAQRAISLVTDPAVIALQREIAPAVTDAMPAVMEKVKAATADLPPARPSSPANTTHDSDQTEGKTQ